MSTEALRLMLGERHLQQTRNRRKLISRLQHNEQQRLPASQSAGTQSNSSIVTGIPHAELAALIASIVDERMNHQLIQDGGAGNASTQLTQPNPPNNLQDSLRSSPPPPPQDGGQNTTQQQPSLPILRQVISSHAPLLLLVLVPSFLQSTFPIQPK